MLKSKKRFLLICTSVVEKNEKNAQKKVIDLCESMS